MTNIGGSLGTIIMVSFYDLFFFLELILNLLIALW